MLIYLSYFIMDLLYDHNVFMILLAFVLVIFSFAIQDIAVDGWAIEMLHPSNRE